MIGVRDDRAARPGALAQLESDAERGTDSWTAKRNCAEKLSNPPDAFLRLLDLVFR